MRRTVQRILLRGVRLHEESPRCSTGKGHSITGPDWRTWKGKENSTAVSSLLFNLRPLGLLLRLPSIKENGHIPNHINPRGASLATHNRTMTEN